MSSLKLIQLTRSSENRCKLEEKMEYEGFAFLERNTKCPTPILSLQNVEIPYFRGKIVVSNLSLPVDLKICSKQLSNTFCRWAQSNNAGRGHTYRIGKIVNEMIRERLLSAPVDFTGSYTTNKKDAKPISGNALFSVS